SRARPLSLPPPLSPPWRPPASWPAPPSSPSPTPSANTIAKPTSYPPPLPPPASSLAYTPPHDPTQRDVPHQLRFDFRLGLLPHSSSRAREEAALTVRPAAHRDRPRLGRAPSPHASALSCSRAPLLFFNG